MPASLFPQILSVPNRAGDENADAALDSSRQGIARRNPPPPPLPLARELAKQASECGLRRTVCHDQHQTKPAPIWTSQVLPSHPSDTAVCQKPCDAIHQISPMLHPLRCLKTLAPQKVRTQSTHPLAIHAIRTNPPSTPCAPPADSDATHRAKSETRNPHEALPCDHAIRSRHHRCEPQPIARREGSAHAAMKTDNRPDDSTKGISSQPQPSSAPRRKHESPRRTPARPAQNSENNF